MIYIAFVKCISPYANNKIISILYTLVRFILVEAITLFAGERVKRIYFGIMSITFIQIIFALCSRCFCRSIHQRPNILDIFNVLTTNCDLILFYLKFLHRVPRKNKSIIPLNRQSKTHSKKVTTIFSSTHIPNYIV